MRSNGKQGIKPTPAIGPAILPIDADPPEGDQERDEESVSNTRNYQAGTKAFREVEAEERDVREAAQADVKDGKQDRKLSLKPRAKTQRPSKEK